MPESKSASREEAPRTADGDSHAELIQRLFREHNDALIRFLVARLRSQQEAKEVAQEAYVRLLSLDRPGAVSFLRAFLYKTAANVAVDRLRSRRREREAKRAGLFDDFRETPTPERVLLGAQDVSVLHQLLEELPPKCRQAFLLQRVYGVHFADIAAQMGVSERMVRKYVVRALTYCRAGLEAARQIKDKSEGAAATDGGKGASQRREKLRG